MCVIKSLDGVICIFGYWLVVDRCMFLYEGGLFINEFDNNDFLILDLYKLFIIEIFRE